MKPVLEVQHLIKEFLIGGTQEPYLSLRDVLSNPFKKLRQPPKMNFRALDDVSFDVMPGDSVGIIGRNGAGKSTLLKILSKITPPTRGKIVSRGRIASLLEVGTGFHMELTGRENIYMNGSILGMRKTEIDRYFDAIVEFSEVENFLDTPLKRYSSGMQLRLAFAVAAHLEPEILIIDEVLAVGDAEFQKKCLGKMNEVSKSGRTVLFVSHNIDAIRTLCTKGVLLQKGKLIDSDRIDVITEKYILLSKSRNNQIVQKDTGKNLFFSDVIIAEEIIEFGASLKILCRINSKNVVTSFTIGLSVVNLLEKVVGTTYIYCDQALKTGENIVSIEVLSPTLVPGDYKCILSIAKGKGFNNVDIVDESLHFTVRATDETLDFFSRWSISWGSNVLKEINIDVN